MVWTAIVRPLALGNKFLQTVLQQGVRRFPINTRPLLGIPKAYSSKGMGFLARGFIRLHQTTGEQVWADKAEFCLQWLIDNQSKGYSGACWGNSFDYISRSFYLPKHVPTIVWTAHIGQAFLDAYEHFHKDIYLKIAVSACEHIMRDLERYEEGDGVCISYIPTKNVPIHNSSTLGGAAPGSDILPYTKRSSTGHSHRRRCNIRRIINGRMRPGITEKKRICTGLIISILRTCWIASNTMSTPPDDHRFDDKVDSRI